MSSGARLWADLRDRAAADRRLAAWGRGRPEGTLIWLHGASAGELLGAAPAVRELRDRRGFALVVTHFSPSGRAVLPYLEPDFATFPPLDTRARCARAVEALRLDLLVYAKLDVWPGLTAAATRAGVPAVLINGVVRPGSRRLTAVSRALLRGTYGRLVAVGAASDEDARRLARLGVRPDAMRVTGDASFDLALSRADAARAPGGGAEALERALPARPEGGVRLIAGSTWPADETALLGALEALPARADGRPGWQVVIAPHQPSEAHVRRLVGECRRRRLPVARWSRPADLAALPPHGVVVFGEVGRLAELYTAGDAAYVGGGLAGAGLHNVLEPAAAGLPILIGGEHDRREAFDLVRSGGATSGPPAGFGAWLSEMADPARRAAAGALARAYVDANAGAAVATADLLERWLSSPGQ